MLSTDLLILYFSEERQSLMVIYLLIYSGNM